MHDGGAGNWNLLRRSRSGALALTRGKGEVTQWLRTDDLGFRALVLMGTQQ